MKKVMVMHWIKRNKQGECDHAETKMTGRFIRSVDKNFEVVIMVILLTSMTLVMFVQVVARYILNASMTWPDEFCRYCFVTTVWFGCAYCVRFRTNLRIDTLLTTLPAGIAFWLDILVDLITMAFFTLMCGASYLVTAKSYSVGTMTPCLELPQYIPYGLMFVGYGVAVLRCIQTIVLKCREKLMEKRKGKEALS
jgi:TRAP-type C4-dicarboxylate transport system permease small subunit